MAEREYLSFASVRERDIDLILVEELQCSPTFLAWFVRQLGPTVRPPQTPSADRVRVQHSRTGSSSTAGETDIQLDWEVQTDRPLRCRLLIENKIDAAFTDRQPERYRERARYAVKEGEADRAVTVLIAPNEYIETRSNVGDFDATISYEELVEYFGRDAVGPEGSISLRSQHRKEMLEQAIYKYRRGGQIKIDVDVSAFWMEYWRLADREFKCLRLARPDPKPARAGFVHFVDATDEYPSLPRCVIKHKLLHGRVDLEVAGWAGKLDSLVGELGAFAPNGAHIIEAGKSLAVSIEVPSLETREPFGQQVDGASDGLRAAACLQAWFPGAVPRLRELAAR